MVGALYPRGQGAACLPLAVASALGSQMCSNYVGY